jgi:hypothetical protein
VSFLQRLRRLFGTIIEQTVVNWGGWRSALPADFDQGGRRRTEKTTRTDTKGKTAKQQGEARDEQESDPLP